MSDPNYKENREPFIAPHYASFDDWMFVKANGPPQQRFTDPVVALMRESWHQSWCSASGQIALLEERLAAQSELEKKLKARIERLQFLVRGLLTEVDEVILKLVERIEELEREVERLKKLADPTSQTPEEEAFWDEVEANVKKHVADENEQRAVVESELCVVHRWLSAAKNALQRRRARRD